MSNSKTSASAYFGFGLGLRSDHYEFILQNKPAVDWFEAITEDYLNPGSRPLYFLDRIRQNYLVALHGVSLSIGSCDPLDFDYLSKVKALAAHVDPGWVSDHLCWTGINGLNMHDLLPLPYTEEALAHISERVHQVQDFLGRQLTLENVSSYISYTHSHLTEWEFLAALTERTDCKILLDVNNIYVSAFNHGFDPQDYLRGIPVDRVQQFHLAGHENQGKYIVDTHNDTIIEPVWDLYADAVRRFGRVNTMIERDDNIPEFPELQQELNQAKAIAEKILLDPAHE